MAKRTVAKRGEFPIVVAWHWGPPKLDAIPAGHWAEETEFHIGPTRLWYILTMNWDWNRFGG